MIDHPPQAPQPMQIHAGLCPYGDGHVYLYAGYACLSFSYEEFLHLAQVVRDIAREIQAQALSQERRTEEHDQHEASSQSFLRPGDPATRLAGVLCLLQTETEPARAEELRRLAAALDEEVRQEVRQYARERAAQARTDKG